MKRKKQLTLTEKFETITAEEFGIRIAQVFADSQSSTAIFFIQQAFKDCEDDNGIYWEPFRKMLARIKTAPDTAEREGEGDTHGRTDKEND